MEKAKPKKKQSVRDHMQGWVNQNNPVIVEWIDSMSSGGWHDYKESDLTCYTVGMLYEDKKDRVVIAMNKSAHGYGDYMEIPKIAIKKVTRLGISGETD